MEINSMNLFVQACDLSCVYIIYNWFVCDENFWKSTLIL